MQRRLAGTTIAAAVLHIIMSVFVAVAGFGLTVLIFAFAGLGSDEYQNERLGEYFAMITAGFALGLVILITIGAFALRSHAWARWAVIGIHTIVAGVIITALAFSGDAEPQLLVLTVPSLAIVGLLTVSIVQETSSRPVTTVAPPR